MMRGLLISVVALAGCTTSLPMSDLVHADRYRSLDHEYSSSVFTVRSFAQDADGNRVEVAGAVCSARNAVAGFRNVQTPAQVQMPAFLQAERYDNRGKPPILKGSCSYNGATQAFAVEATSAVPNVSRSLGGTYNSTTGIYSNPTSIRLNRRLSSTTPWRYPSVVVEF